MVTLNLMWSLEVSAFLVGHALMAPGMMFLATASSSSFVHFNDAKVSLHTGLRT